MKNFALPMLLLLAQTNPPEPKDLNLQTLTKIESQWRAQNILRYDFTLIRTCFCAPKLAKLHVGVRGTKIYFKGDTGLSTFAGMDKLFAAMQDQLQKNGRVAVVMNARYKFPTQVILDPLPKATDDELYLSVVGFKKY